MQIKIDSDFAVSIFDDGADVPFLFQPHYPNGDSFDSVDEAQKWADLQIASITDSKAPYAPAGKGLAGEPKTTMKEGK